MATSTRALRIAGALALIVMGAVHLQQFLGEYGSVRTIGPLFALNFAGGLLVGLGLLLPIERIAGRAGAVLLSLVGIAMAATSIVFLLISEQTQLFGFQESGYRAAIVIALAAEGAAVLLLGAWLLVTRTSERPEYPRRSPMTTT